MDIALIKPNPNNPRVLRDDKFKKLKKSIQEFPEMLELREIIVDEDMVILGGNMRYKALKELGIKDVPVKIAKGLTEEQKKSLSLKTMSGSENGIGICWRMNGIVRALMIGVLMFLKSLLQRS
jgi:ParB-like chromosome segregation protein Spo0J